MRQAFSHFLFCAVETRHLRRQSFAAPVILCHGAFANRSHLLCLLHARRSSRAGRFCPSSREAAPRPGKGRSPAQTARVVLQGHLRPGSRPAVPCGEPTEAEHLPSCRREKPGRLRGRHARCARVHACGEPCRRRRRLPRRCIPAFDPLMPEIVYRSVGWCGSIRIRHETFMLCMKQRGLVSVRRAARDSEQLKFKIS